MLWIVTVEAWDSTGNGDYYEVAVLSHAELGARMTACRAVTKRGLTGAHSVDATVVDPYKTGAVLVARKEADHGQTPPRPRQQEVT